MSGNHYFSSKFIFIIVFLISLLHSNSRAQNSIALIVEKINGINDSVRILETRLLELESKNNQIISDSTRIISESQITLASLQDKVRQIDQIINTRDNEISSIKTKRSNLSNDSVQAVLKFRTDNNEIQVKLKQLEKLVFSIDSEIDLSKQRRQQLNQFSTQQSDPEVIRYQTEKHKNDSIMAIQQESLNSIHRLKTQLTSDSLAQVAILQNSRDAEDKVTQEIENDLQNINAGITSVKSSIAQSRSVLSEKKIIFNDVIQKLISRKASMASSFSQSTLRLKKMEVDLSKLQAGASEIQKKYSAGRMPIETQLSSINQTLLTRGQQQVVWKAMREKFVIDSMIRVTRNELDNLIQQSAGGKRSARKMVDDKEGELNALYGKRDLFISNQGIKQIEEQIAQMTITQQRARIEQVLTNIADDIIKQTNLKIQTENTLAQYDISNPIGTNSSMEKYRQADTLVRMERQKSEMLKVQVDSVDMVIKVYNDSIKALNAFSNDEIALFEKELNSFNTQKNNKVVMLDQKKKITQDTKIKNSNKFTPIINEIKSTDIKISVLENDIGVAQRRSLDTQNRIIASQQKFEQMKTSALQEIRSIDNAIAEKENGQLGLTNQNTQHAEQIKILEADLQKKLAVLSSSKQSVDQQVSMENTEMQKLSNQKSGLLLDIESARKKSDTELLSFRSTGANLQKNIRSIKLEISSLQLKRSLLVKNVQDIVFTIQKEIENARKETERSKFAYQSTLQDSVNLEKSRERAYSQVKSKIDKQDSLVEAVNFQFQNVSVELEKARIDSSETIRGASLSILPHIQKIRVIDSTIIVKERELAALRNQKAQAIQDSITEASNLRSLVAQVQSRLRQKNEYIASLKLQVTVQANEKKRLESEAAAIGKQFKDSRASISLKLESSIEQIARNERKTEQLNVEFNSAEKALSYINENQKNISQNSKLEIGIKSNEDIQVVIEKIYELIGENRMSEARSMFLSQKSRLQEQASPDAFNMLQDSF